MNTKTKMMLGVAAAVALVPAAVGCASSSTPSAPATSATAAPTTAAPPPTTPASASSGYPQQAADEALCSAYQSASGDLQAMSQAVQQAGSSVSPVLARDIMYVVNNPGSVSQDEHNMIYVAMDCALVHVGKQPVELNKQGG